MKNFTKIILIFHLIFIPTLSSAEEIIHVTPSTITKQEIIELSQAGLSNKVIISQIKTTNTKFKLTSEEIIALKDAGVKEEVIDYMINTGTPIPRAILVEPPPATVRMEYYYGYNPWYNYWWNDPWYDDWWYRRSYWRRRRWRRRGGFGFWYRD